MSENTMQNPYAKVTGTLLYVCIQEPTKAYQKPGTDPKPNEYKVSVALTDEDYVDELEDWAAKNDIKLSMKKVKTTAFEETYKIAPPEGAGKNVWVWTLRKSTELGKTGKTVPPQFRPKVFQRKCKVLVDVTNYVLVGNGSVGTVSTDLFVRNNGSASIYPKNVMVTDLVEYVRSEGESYVEGSEFMDEETEVQTAKPTEDKPKASTKAKPKVEQPEDDDSDSLPF